jgi:hypothetical protein
VRSGGRIGQSNLIGPVFDGMHLMQFGEAKGGTWNTLSNFIMNVPDDYKASDIKRELGVVEA